MMYKIRHVEFLTLINQYGFCTVNFEFPFFCTSKDRFVLEYKQAKNKDDEQQKAYEKSPKYVFKEHYNFQVQYFDSFHQYKSKLNRL